MTQDGGITHAAMAAPASTPNAKTATPVITRAGVRDVKVLCVARRCSAMGTRQRSPTPAPCEARFVPAVVGGRFWPGGTIFILRRSCGADAVRRSTCGHPEARPRLGDRAATQYLLNRYRPGFPLSIVASVARVSQPVASPKPATILRLRAWPTPTPKRPCFADRRGAEQTTCGI
jgi:hypothetical protein